MLGLGFRVLGFLELPGFVGLLGFVGFLGFRGFLEFLDFLCFPGSLGLFEFVGFLALGPMAYRAFIRPLAWRKTKSKPALHPQTLKPSNPQTLKPSNPQTLKPSNPQTLKPSNPPQTRLNPPQTLKPSNPPQNPPQTRLKPSNPQTLKPYTLNLKKNLNRIRESLKGSKSAPRSARGMKRVPCYFKEGGLSGNPKV